MHGRCRWGLRHKWVPRMFAWGAPVYDWERHAETETSLYGMLCTRCRQWQHTHPLTRVVSWRWL
ncbi:hypothetical protein SEA_EFRA2_36 [Mycobacterium phage Efra2]|nr:hypothetical protein SEA_EFRA2_36 [Mycobacterium phage Efra2]